MHSGNPTTLISFEESCWTPRAIEAISTAKALATPGAITATDLLRAMEVGDHLASRVLKQLEICPSAAFGQRSPVSLSQGVPLYYEDFDYALRQYFPRLAFEEAKAMDSLYCGAEHILLCIAQIGVAGLELPYEQIRQRILEVRKSA